MKIEEILKQPEGRRIEFKETFPTKSDLCKTVAAFANDAGGEIIIGIKNKPREVVGISEENLIENEKDYIEQLRTIMNEYEQLSLEEQKLLLYLLDNPKIRRKEATNLLKLKNTKTYEILNSLVEKGEALIMF